MSIHRKIYTDIEQRILSGEYPPGMALASIRSLAAEYKTSPETVRIALKDLRDKELIQPVHGKGNFVAEKKFQFKDVLVISPLKGDFHQDIITSFIRIFSRYNDRRLLLEHFDFSDGMVLDDSYHTRVADLCRLIENRLNSGSLDAIFFEGYSQRALSFLKKYLGKTQLFCFGDQSQLMEVPCPSVSIDYYHGYYIALRHLCEAGCKNIMIRSFPLNPEGIYSRHETLIHETAERIMEEFSVTCHFVERTSFHQMNAAERALLESHPEIDGIFSKDDRSFKLTNKNCNELGRIPGKDILEVGFYNTPWCEMLTPELSSVECFPEQIVERITDIYFHKGPPCQFAEHIAPKLVIRESSIKQKSIE